jgi:Sulfotransferase domain
LEKAVNEPLPTFLIIGAMKSGTTSLHRYLDAHPQVFMSRPKELNFFSSRENWRRGVPWYERHFAKAPEGAVAKGEASTNYSKYPEFSGVPERIAGVIPTVRLIYVLRDPIERMISHYRHRVATGRERRSIDEALLHDPIYADASRYSMQIQQYLRYFTLEQMLLVTSEQLRSDRIATVQRIWKFLGVDKGFVPATLGREFHGSASKRAYRSPVGAVRHKKGVDLLARVTPTAVRRAVRPLLTTKGPDLEPPPDALRPRLQQLIRPDVRRLRSYLGDSFDGWGIG